MRLGKPFLLLLYTTATGAVNIPFDFSSKKFPRPLSDKVARIYQKVYQTVAGNPGFSGIPASSIATSGKFINQVLEYGNYPTHCEKIFYPALKAAREEIVLTTYLYDRNTPCGRLVKKALIELNRELEGTGKRIRVYMVLSSVSLVSFWKRPNINLPDIANIFVPLLPANPQDFDLPLEDELPNLDYEIKTYHEFSVGTIHSKILVVDAKILVVGSKNLDDFGGMEYATWLEGPVALSARMDFQDAWGEQLPELPLGAASEEPSLEELSMLYVPRSSNHHLYEFPENNAQDQAWLTAMDQATESVFIYSPSFNCKTAYNKVIELVRKGIEVTIITNFHYEDFGEKLYPDNVGTNINAAERIYMDLAKDPEATMARLTFCYFIGQRVKPARPDKNEMTHVKFMSVDDEFFIYGSGNMDGQSWHHSREVNVLVDDVRKTIETKRYLLSNQQSLQHCFRDKNGRIEITPLVEIPDPDIHDSVS